MLAQFGLRARGCCPANDEKSAEAYFSGSTEALIHSGKITLLE